MSRSPARSIPARFEHLVVLTAYLCAAAVMSYPLIAQFRDHIPGVDGDVWSYLWALGWARVALLDLGVNPFHSDYLFYPLGGAAQLLWGTALPGFASFPLQFAFGLVPAFNLVYLGATVLTGYGTYLLAKQELKQAGLGRSPHTHTETYALMGASFLAGLIFSFSALRLGYGIAFTNLFHTEFIPFYILFLLRATRRREWRDAVLAGLFFALNVYVDFQIAAFLAILTALWCLYFAVTLFLQGTGTPFGATGSVGAAGTDERRQTIAQVAVRWLAILATAGILALPMLTLVLEEFSIEGENYIRVYPLRYSEARSYDLLSFVVPNARSSVYQSIGPRVEGVNVSVHTEGDTELSPDRQAFLGVTVLALTLLGAVRFRRALLFWIFAAFLFAILSLGPSLQVAGTSTALPLPFAVANNIPILNHIRIPMRYGMMLFFAVSILAGAGALVLFSWKNWLVVPLAALVLIEAAVIPYPTLQVRTPEFYNRLAQDADDYTVLEIPSFHWRHAAQNGIYQLAHHKRILRAYSNRIAPDIADYFNFRSMPIVVKTLRILEGAEPNEVLDDRVEQDRRVLSDTVRFFNLRYAVLHRDQLEAEEVNKVDLYLREVLFATEVYRDETITAYEFTAPAALPRALNLDLADNSSLMYLGRGWQIEPLAEVAGERGRHLNAAAGEIYFPPTRDVPRTIQLRVLNQGAPTTLGIELNDMRLEDSRVEAGWQDLTINLPETIVRPRLNQLKIHTSVEPTSLVIGSFVLQ